MAIGHRQASAEERVTSETFGGGSFAEVDRAVPESREIDNFAVDWAQPGRKQPYGAAASYSAVSRSACFTLGRSEATARRKWSGAEQAMISMNARMAARKAR